MITRLLTTLFFFVLLAFAPFEARADSGADAALRALISDLREEIVKMRAGMNQVIEALDKGNTKRAEFEDTGGDRNAKNIASAFIDQFNKGAPLYVARVAGDTELNAARMLLEEAQRQLFQVQYSQLFRNENSGNGIEDKRWLQIKCALGITGERYGKESCAVAADAEVQNSDVYPGNVLFHGCIPLKMNDFLMEVQAINEALKNNSEYKLQRPDQRKALAAFVALRETYSMDQARYPMDKMMASSEGVRDAVEMSSVVNRESAPLPALLQAVSYHFCPSREDFKGVDCKSNDKDALRRIGLYLDAETQKYVQQKGEYCLSHKLMDVAEARSNWEALMEINKGNGTQTEKIIAAALLTNNTNALRSSYIQMVTSSSSAATGANGEAAGVGNTRAIDPNASKVKPESASSDPELLSAIRELTKAIKSGKGGTFDGKLHEVKAQDPEIHDALKELGLRASAKAPSQTPAKTSAQ